MILGDGTRPGSVIVRRSLLQQICAQMDGSAIDSSDERLGLLLGPEPQDDGLHVVETIPLESEYGFAPLRERLLAGTESVQPMLEDAWQQRSHIIVGWYRILRSSEGRLPESGLEFVSTNWPQHSSQSDVRCCFVFVCLPASEILLRVYMRNGGNWEEIQELTLQSEPSPDLTPQHPPATLNVTEPPRAGEPVSPMAKNVHGRGRFWFEVAVVTLLLLSLALNAVMVRFARRIQSEKANLQPVVDQIRESASVIPQLPAPAAASVPEAPPGNQELAKADPPPQQVSNPPRTGNLAIARKPATLKPSEAFQFEVEGNPSPEVRWSSEGPGSIDPVYGLYRAPSQFAGETKVRIIAKSWSGSQSVTFTLKGGSK